MRIKRVNQLIKEKIANIILRELSFKDFLVTIQNVETSKDLRSARIKISVVPIEKSEQGLKILEKNIFNLQKELNKSIEIKFVPKIKFEIDKGEENADRIEKILSKI